MTSNQTFLGISFEVSRFTLIVARFNLSDISMAMPCEV